MPKKVDPGLKARAVRLVTDHRQEYPKMTAACVAVGKQLGGGKESMRRWVAQAQIDAGRREGPTTEEHAEITRRHRDPARIQPVRRVHDVEPGVVDRCVSARCSALPFLYNVWKTHRSAPEVDTDDPWGWGRSLEWATSCPPPRHNYVRHHPEIRNVLETDDDARPGDSRQEVSVAVAEDGSHAW